MRLTWVAWKRNATLGLVLAIALCVVSVGVVMAQNAAEQQQSSTAVTFSGDVAMVLNYIKTDKASEFENAMQKVKEALQKSEVPERKQQAAGWKVLKSPENAGEGQTLYVFLIEPVVKGADYSVGKILQEGFPTDYAEYFNQYAQAFGKGRIVLNLNNVVNMGQ
jgi:hypothetical protein